MGNNNEYDSPPVSPTFTKVNSQERHHYNHDEVAPSAVPASAPADTSRLGRYRSSLKTAAAEFVGTAVLVMFGCAGGAQAVLSANPNVTSSIHGDWSSIALGWGIGIGLGAWISGGISGGHINPAVTLALATWRGFPWRKVPAYIFAQLMGGIFGAALVYANYYHAINLFEGGSRRTLATAGFFGTYALDYVPDAAAFFSEFTGAFLLMLIILACTDTRNGPIQPGLLPIALFFLLFGLGICFGMQTGFAVNPARDFGPRILTAIAGWGRQVFSYRHQYWLWGGIIAPILGMQVAAMFYDMFVYDGEDSLINRFLSRRKRNSSKSGKASAGGSQAV